MKKILFFVTHPLLGGSQEYIYDLTRVLFYEREYYVIVITLFNGPLVEKLKKNQIEVKVFNLGDIFKNLTSQQFFFVKFIKLLLFFFISISLILRLLFFIKKKKIHLIYNNTFRAQILGGITAKLLGIPNFWHIHGNFKINIFHYIAAKIADKIIVLSEKVKNDVAKIGDKGKFTVVYNGVDLKRFSYTLNSKKIKDEYGIKISEKVIGMIGTLIPLKGHQYFIEAAALVIKYYPNVKFLIVGDEPFFKLKKEYLKSLQQLSCQLGLTEHFIFTGYKSNLEEVLAAFDILVVSSLEEGFGRVIIEAMAMKKIVVATNVGGIPEIVINQQTGILVPPKQTLKIAEAIIELLNDEIKWQKMAENGYQRVVKLFSLTKTKEKSTLLFNTWLKVG